MGGADCRAAGRGPGCRNQSTAGRRCRHLGCRDGLRLGVWFLQVVLVSFSVFEMFAKTGLAVARAMATREAAAGLTLMAVTAGLSLSMLHALLFSKKESSSW